MVLNNNKKNKPQLLLLGAIGFFATWGEGMQHVLPKSSVIYPILVALYIVVNFDRLSKVIKRRAIVPQEFKFLFLYILIHTFVYILFNLQSIGFGTEVRMANEEGFSYGRAESGVIIVRYFLFFLFSLILTVVLSNNRRLNFFSTAYVLGFICTILLGGASHGYGNSLVRISGGLKDPNAMAFDAIISFIFSLYLYGQNRNKTVKFLFIVSMIIEFLAIFLSFSRGAYLALMLWGFYYMYRKGLLNNVWKFSLAALTFFFIGYIAIKTIGIDTEVLEDRFSVQEIKERRGASRGYIWEAYIDNIDQYALTGTGIANSSSVLKGNRFGVEENYETHNLYLQMFVEYGIVGLLLYLLYWRNFFRVYKKVTGGHFILISMGIILLVVTFFLNIDKGRTYWIVFATLNMVWMSNSPIKGNMRKKNNSNFLKEIDIHSKGLYSII